MESLDFNLGEEEEEEESLTAQEVLATLQEAWSNEKLAPELLPHKSEYVEVMMEQVEQMEDNLNRLDPTDLRYLIHKQELERIRYLLRSYLRERLRKIELFSLSLLTQQSLLSDQETQFLKERVTADLSMFKALGDRMEGPIGQLNPEEMKISADLEASVFVRAKQPVTAVLPEENEEITMVTDSQHIIPYSAIQSLLHSSKVTLI